jgi:cysteinyl-tRNA synthetase
VELLGRADYLSVIDGVGAEDTFYYHNRPAPWSDWDVQWLDKAVQAGKIVLATDYSTRKEQQCDFIKKARERGYIPFVSVRQLDKIIQVDCP